MDFYVSVAWIVGPLATLIMLVVFILIVKKCTLSVLTTLTSMYVGFIILYFEFSFITREVRALEIFPLGLGPIIGIIGYLIIIIPMYINLDKISNNSEKIFRFSLLAVVSYCVISFITGIYLLNMPKVDINQSLSYFYLPVIFILAFFYIIKRKNILMNKTEALKPEEGYSNLFTKPKRITEEEVSIAKEKQICLVCKNKLEGTIFLCSECGAFYCIKCYNVLNTLENQCWVCDCALDNSKPIKEKEEEPYQEIEIVQKKR